MALFDGKIRLQTSLEEAWEAARQTLTPAEKLVSSTPNAAFAAMDSVLGYLYIFHTRSTGEISIRLLIDEAPRVREVFRTYKGADALDMLATLGSSDPVFTERINQVGKQRLRMIEEIIGSKLNVAQSLTLAASKKDVSDSASPTATMPESIVQHTPPPDWLVGLSSALPPDGRTAVPKVIASPYAEPIVHDKRQLWWVVSILSVVFVLGMLILIILVRQLSGDRTYSGQWFSLKLPAGWSKIAPDSRTEICGGGAVCPLVIGKDPYHFVALYFNLETRPTSQTIQDIETKYWYEFQAQHPQYTFANQHTEQLLGRPVVIIEYLVPHSPDTYYLTQHIILLNSTTSLHVVGYGISAFQYEEARYEIEQIIQSLTINS